MTISITRSKSSIRPLSLFFAETLMRSTRYSQKKGSGSAQKLDGCSRNSKRLKETRNENVHNGLQRPNESPSQHRDEGKQSVSEGQIKGGQRMRKSRRTAVRQSLHRRKRGTDGSMQSIQGSSTRAHSGRSKQVLEQRRDAEALQPVSLAAIQQPDDVIVLREEIKQVILGKTQRALLALTKDESDQIGRRVEELLQNEMKYISNWYVNKYNVAVAMSLGWSKEDLLQNIRIAMWKGLATFDASKKFKVETYLSSILEHYFASLAKRCRSAQRQKASVCKQQTATLPDKPDDVYQHSRSVASFMSRLTELEVKVLEEHVIKGRSIPEVAKSLNEPRNKITRTVKTLRIELKHHIRRDEDDGEKI